MSDQVVIIGAGLSGLAAGIRLSHFGKDVTILEAHSLCGGLNSYYRRKGTTIDVGLHAMTNFVPRGTRGAPLTKLLRQLRIRYDELGLIEQRGCRIQFPGRALQFTNNFDDLRRAVAKAFPDQVENFDRLAEMIDEFDEVDLDPPELSAREEMAKFISRPDLIEMLLVPIMYYGNPCEVEMDFTQFAIMWKSIYQMGFARPAAGMKHVINLLVDRFQNNGGKLRRGARVTKLQVDGARVTSVILEDGEEIPVSQVFSSAGLVETTRLCSNQPDDVLSDHVGRLSFVELVAFLDRPAAELGIDDTIIFFNNAETFTYQQPTGLIDNTSGVICCPGNFDYPTPPKPDMIRLTAKASFPEWQALTDGLDPHAAGPEAQKKYAEAKEQTIAMLLDAASQQVGDLREHITFTDLFTPLTIKRFTGHQGGAVYGSPDKHRHGETECANLFLCGTDQGFLGIVGAILSGISMANMHGLT